MRHRLSRYAVFVLAILFVCSYAEAFEEECEECYANEMHEFTTADSSIQFLKLQETRSPDFHLGVPLVVEVVQAESRFLGKYKLKESLRLYILSLRI